MIDMDDKNKKDMEIFYKKALKKILNFKASELSTVEFELYDNTNMYESVGFGDFVVKDEYSEYRVFDEDEFKELYEEVR